MKFRSYVVVASLFSLLLPIVAAAFPFGGRITVHHVCYNETIFARLSPPVPGDYVWTRATKTYQFGPPQYVGQWLLGLTSMPYDCLWSVNPIWVQPAIAIMMMGSSGAAAPAYVPPPQQGPAIQTNVAAPKSKAAPTATKADNFEAPDALLINPQVQLGKVTISEVYYDVNVAHGEETKHEWVEIYNGTENTVNLAGWKIQNASLSDELPSGTTVAPGAFLLVVADGSALQYWSVSTNVKIVALDGSIGSGLANAGDVLRLRNTANTIIDSVSWGTNTSSLDPSVPIVAEGHSMARSSPRNDTNKAADWIDRTTPTPGK